MLVSLRVHRVTRESSIIFFVHDAAIGCSKEKRENHPKQALNPLYPNIRMYILQTSLFKFPNVLARRIHLTIKRFFS